MKTHEHRDDEILFPLRPIQKMMLNLHLQNAPTTMLNAGELLKIDDSIDLERLATAANKVLDNNDIFRLRLVVDPESGEVRQRFDGEVKKITVEKISDEDFEKLKSELRKPYEIFDNPLYTIRIFETPTARYAYTELLHVIADGMSIAVLFFREVDMNYANPDRPTRKNPSYAEYVLEESKIPDAELAEGREFWRGMLADFDIAKHLPPPDGGNPTDPPGHELICELKNRLPENFFVGKSYAENTFYVAVAMLAIANLTGAKNSVLSWVHSGRTTMKESRILGLMLDQFPIAWDFADDPTAGEFLSGLDAKINSGMEFRKSLDVVYTEALEDDCATVIFQKSNLGRHANFPVGGKPATYIELPHNEDYIEENVLDIEFNLTDEEFFLVLSYDTKVYSRAAMTRFADKIEDILDALRDESKPVSELLKM